MSPVPDEMLGHIRGIVADLEGSAARVLQVERWGGGAHSTCYKVAAAGGGRYLLKVEAEEILPRTRRDPIRKEAAGLRLATEAGVPCPRLLAHDAEGAAHGIRFALLEFVDQPLAGELWGDLSEAERTSLRGQVDDVVARLAAARAPCYGDTYAGGLVGQHTTWRAAATAWTMLVLEDAAALGAFSDEDLRVVSESARLACGAITSRDAPALMHNDLHEYNAFARRGASGVRLTHVFDWANTFYAPAYLPRFALRRAGVWGYPKDARLRDLPATSAEQDAWWFLCSLEMRVFLSTIRFRPDDACGYRAQNEQLVAQCRERLAVA